MRSVVFLCLVAAVLVPENVITQHFSSYYTRQYLRNRNTAGFFSSGSSVVGTYVPSAPKIERDVVSKKVRLDIFYETDCPDSMRFFTSQLYPLYQEMEDLVDIHLVPYGKAYEVYNEDTKKYDFYCHHGASECHGNTVQSCAISMYPEKDYMNFINCMESYPRPSRSGQKCARRMSLDWEKINKCATGDEGNRLLHEMAQLTENLDPQLYFVPWILVDKEFNRRTHRMALRNLKHVVCNACKIPHYMEHNCRKVISQDLTGRIVN